MTHPSDRTPEEIVEEVRAKAPLVQRAVDESWTFVEETRELLGELTRRLYAALARSLPPKAD